MTYKQRQLLNIIAFILYLIMAIILALVCVLPTEAAGPNPCDVYNNWSRTCYPVTARVYRTTPYGVRHSHRLVTVCRCVPK